MKIKVNQFQTMTIPGGKRLLKINPLGIVALVFGGLGLLFGLMGGIFVHVSRELLPRLADPMVWLGEAPEELELAMVGVVFAILGGVFVIAALVMLLISLRQRRMHEELLTWGERVKGQVSDIPVDMSIAINNRHPLRIMVQVRHPRTGEMLNLKGPRVWQTSLSPGDPIDVLFDPMKDGRFVVDYNKEAQS